MLSKIDFFTLILLFIIKNPNFGQILTLKLKF